MSRPIPLILAGIDQTGDGAIVGLGFSNDGEKVQVTLPLSKQWIDLTPGEARIMAAALVRRADWLQGESE